MERLSVPPITSLRQPASGNYTSHFHGVPIEQISFDTIFNPHINRRGFRKDGTFDVWKLAEKSWSVQKKISEGFPVTRGDVQHALNNLQRELTLFDPLLILILTDSSTDRDFWRHMTRIREADTPRSSQCEHYKEKSDFLTWPLHLPFDELGQPLLMLLTYVEKALDRYR